MSGKFSSIARATSYDSLFGVVFEVSFLLYFLNVCLSLLKVELNKGEFYVMLSCMECTRLNECIYLCV